MQQLDTALSHVFLSDAAVQDPHTFLLQSGAEGLSAVHRECIVSLSTDDALTFIWQRDEPSRRCDRAGSQLSTATSHSIGSDLSQVDGGANQLHNTASQRVPFHSLGKGTAGLGFDTLSATLQLDTAFADHGTFALCVLGQSRCSLPCCLFLSSNASAHLVLCALAASFAGRTALITTASQRWIWMLFSCCQFLRRS